MEHHGEKIEYRCSNCGNPISYGSELAIQGEYDDIFCSQECLYDWYGFEKFDWSKHPEYYEHSKEEREEIHRKNLEEWEEWKKQERRLDAEKEARRKECEPYLKQLEASINDLLAKTIS